jgi:hypothetical protein
MATNSHEIIGIIDVARKENILLLCLPPHDSVGWFSKVIDGVKASEGIASGLNGRIPQERNPEIILAGFTDWSKADVKSLGQVFVLSTVLTLCLPPHTSHFLCPFDRTVFGWLSKEYNKQYSSFVSANPVNTVDKTKTWPKLFTSAFDQSVNPANIISGFCSCGILPFNPLAVPPEALFHFLSARHVMCNSSLSKGHLIYQLPKK